MPGLVIIGAPATAPLALLMGAGTPFPLPALPDQPSADVVGGGAATGPGAPPASATVGVENPSTPMAVVWIQAGCGAVTDGGAYWGGGFCGGGAY
jgi:hypothetical protein